MKSHPIHLAALLITLGFAACASPPPDEPVPLDIRDYPIVATPIACGEVLFGRLPRNLSANYKHGGQAGQEIRLRIQPLARGQQLSVGLFDPQGALVAYEAPCGDAPESACLDTTLEHTGEYHFRVAGRRAIRYSIALECPAAPKPQRALEELPCHDWRNAAADHLEAETEPAVAYLLDTLPRQIEDTDTCTVSLITRLDTPDFTPQATWRGAPLESVCVFAPGGPRCQAMHGDDLPGRACEGPFVGICGVLAVAQSLYRTLGQVGDEVTVVRDGKRLWDRAFLEELRRHTEHRPGVGTYLEGEQAAHIAYGVDACTDLEKPRSGQDIDVRAWCLGLTERVGQADCGLRIHSRILGFFWDTLQFGHSMHIRTATWDAESEACTIVTSDTGVQGCGHGEDIPVEPGTQTWRIQGTNLHTLLNVNISPDDPNFAFWATRGYNTAGWFCCE